MSPNRPFVASPWPQPASGARTSVSEGICHLVVLVPVHQLEVLYDLRVGTVLVDVTAGSPPASRSSSKTRSRGCAAATSSSLRDGMLGGAWSDTSTGGAEPRRRCRWPPGGSWSASLSSAIAASWATKSCGASR